MGKVYYYLSVIRPIRPIRPIVSLSSLYFLLYVEVVGLVRWFLLFTYFSIDSTKKYLTTFLFIFVSYVNRSSIDNRKYFSEGFCIYIVIFCICAINLYKYQLIIIIIIIIIINNNNNNIKFDVKHNHLRYIRGITVNMTLFSNDLDALKRVYRNTSQRNVPNLATTENMDVFSM